MKSGLVAMWLVACGSPADPSPPAIDADACPVAGPLQDDCTPGGMTTFDPTGTWAATGTETGVDVGTNHPRDFTVTISAQSPGCWLVTGYPIQAEDESEPAIGGWAGDADHLSRDVHAGTIDTHTDYAACVVNGAFRLSGTVISHDMENTLVYSVDATLTR